MTDNRQIKDGLGNLFTIRMRDVSSAHDGTVQRSLIFATPYPVDYGLGGIYQHCARSGAMAAAALTQSPIYSFQWASTSLIALVTKVRISAWTTGVGFAAGIAGFSLFVARGFAVQDSGGTAASFAGDNVNLATAMSASVANIMVANTAALTPGTRTLDADPLDIQRLSAPVTTNAPFSPAPLRLLDRWPGEHPLLLANNEGFEVVTTVPTTGTWQFAVTTEWAEVPAF